MYFVQKDDIEFESIGVRKYDPPSEFFLAFMLINELRNLTKSTSNQSKQNGRENSITLSNENQH